MQRPDRRLVGLTPGQEPAQAKPLLGRAALVEGLMAPPKEHEGTPHQISASGRDGAQILASRLILETATELSGNRERTKAYVEELERQAGRIVRARAEREDVIKPGKRAIAVPEGRPATRKGVLEAALAACGHEAEITLEKSMDGKSLFTVVCNGETNKVPISDSVMAAIDPVAAAVKILGVIDIGTTAEKKREQAIAQRRSTRPPATPLGLGEGELDSRMVTFDGSLEKPGESEWIFTYLAPGLETSFSIPSGTTGRSLLDAIDSKLEAIHEQYGRPYPAQVIETIAAGRGGKGYLAAIPSDSLGVARALDRLVSDYIGKVEPLVPQEYLDAYRAMKKLERPREVWLSAFEMENLKRALDELDHPVYSVVKESYGRGGMPITEGVREEILSLLRIAPMVGPEICDAALGNMAGAYRLVGGTEVPDGSMTAALRKDYFRISFIVRMGIKRAIADGRIACE